MIRARLVFLSAALVVACSVTDDEAPATGRHDARWQTIIAHEFGHYVNHLKSGLSNFSLGINSSNAACKCDHVLDIQARSHCLQSLVGNGFALNEGFAHFFAAQVFQAAVSSQCIFAYYKEFREDSLVIDSPPVLKHCDAPVTWETSHCGLANSTLEWDWLNALWNVRTDAQTPYSMDDLGSVWREACTGNPNTNCNGQTLTAALLITGAQGVFGLGSQKALDFDSDLSANGVKY